MAAFATVAAGLQVAMLLARGRPEALRYVEPGLDGARRSFWAAAICLPLFAGLHLATWRAAAAPGHAFALDFLGYVVGWTGFALLSRPVVAWIGRAGRWPRFIAAWNWCNVAQYVLLVAAATPGWLHAPDWAQQAAGLVAAVARMVCGAPDPRCRPARGGGADRAGPAARSGAGERHRGAAGVKRSRA